MKHCTPTAGIEPATVRLTAGSSSTKLSRIDCYLIFNSLRIGDTGVDFFAAADAA